VATNLHGEHGAAAEVAAVGAEGLTKEGARMGRASRIVEDMLPVADAAAAAEPAGATLSAYFQWCAARHADRVAMVYDKTELTYRELGLRVGQLARLLRSHGIERGDHVAVCMPRCAEMLVVVLGVIEAGAVYVPIDTRAPLDRIAYICKDCDARLIVTTSKIIENGFPTPVLRIDRERSALARQPREAVALAESGVAESDLAYVIYTSGTTGRPKGVMIQHASICHLVRSEGSVLGVRPEDRVLQGFSLSFDMSLEEIWTTLWGGATLVVATDQMMASGPELARTLEELGITIWHTVPTLLAAQEQDVRSLRLLNLGGEACPADLARRWQRKGRRVLNTYGPTETTVTATYAELAPGDPITIGVPLPGYDVYVVDEELRPVPHGVEGELCIGGPGLAAGYLNRPDLTQERFVTAPFAGPDGNAPRLYRSGDLARIDEAGRIDFHGRRDGQIKIRGFRVELAEIESVLLEQPGVQGAAAALLKDPGGIEAIAAFVVLRPGAALDDALTWQQLRARLPPYMLPAALAVETELPRLPSGKVDRGRLAFPATAVRPPKAMVAPATAAEERVHAVWSDVFAPVAVSADDDFFLDLGGHSLKAAQVVSRLRKLPGFEGLSMQDVYRRPTVQQLAELGAAVSASVAAGTAPAPLPHEAFQAVPRARYWACVAAQTLCLGPIFAVVAIQWLLPFVVYIVGIDRGFGIPRALAASVAASLAAVPLYFALGIGTKWLVIGRYREGDHPLWGLYYLRWWLVRRVLSLVPEGLILETPLMAVYLRLLGARVGRHVHVAGGKFDAIDLVSVGDHTSIGLGAMLSCCSVEHGLLRIRRVEVGRGCYVGNAAAVGQGARLEDGAELGDLSSLPAGQTIPAFEAWSGSPARLNERLAPRPLPERCYSPRSAAALVIAGLLLPLFGLLPFLPSLAFLADATRPAGALRLAALSIPLGLGFVVLMCLEVAAVKWLVLGRVRAEQIPLAGLKYARHWFVERLMAMSLALAKPLYATLYLTPWYRLLGVRVGRRAEVSTASAIAWDLLDLADECFVADGVLLGPPRVHRGMLDLRRTHIGRRTFLGNNALVPGGVHTGDNVLIGCLSVPPADPVERARGSASWFGSPAIFLPQREIVGRFDESVTYRPPRRLVAARLTIELLRILFPVACGFALLALGLFVVASLWEAGYGVGTIILLLPVLYAAVGVCSAVITIVMKELVVGRYEPIVRPLWSHFVWRSEAITCLYETLVVPTFLDHLRGTPWVNVVLRWLGCRIGKRVYTDTTDITEHDVVTVGDDAALNEGCGLQTHLFEDRVMKVSHVRIGPRCVVGADSIVLYDSEMEADAQLGDLSMLMKAETLPSATDWEGSPAMRRSGAL
jgi:non-ribosomal peptide synthetase-like protein